MEAAVQTDILMSRIFGDLGTSTLPSGLVDVPVLTKEGDVAMMSAEVVKQEPVANHDHTY